MDTHYSTKLEMGATISSNPNKSIQKKRRSVSVYEYSDSSKVHYNRNSLRSRCNGKSNEDNLIELGKTMMVSNCRHVKTLDLFEASIAKYGLASALKSNSRLSNIYWAQILECICENERLWNIETASIIVKNLGLILLNKSVQVKLIGLNLLKKIMHDFGDSITENRPIYRDFIEDLLQIAVNEAMITGGLSVAAKKDIKSIVSKIYAL